METFINRSQATKSTKLSYLGGCGTSSKIIKNSKVLNIDTYVLYLAPFNMSGFNVCPMATKECIAGCLNTSGRAAMEINSDNENQIINARIAKTKLFYSNRKFFMSWLVAEITAKKALAESIGNEFAVRLNGTSDLNWNAYKLDGKTIFETFPTVQFYDYTKVPSRFNNVPKNYHLTFSYTGENWTDCKKVLDNGYNIAVVFNLQKWHNSVNARPLPVTFKGYNVIDADVTDYRPLDGKKVIAGLRWKRIADKEAEKNVRNSKFVVNPDSKECSYDMNEKKVASLATF